MPAGKELVREGDYSYDLIVIEEGTAKVEREGRQHAELGPATSSARWACWRQQRNATVRATSPMLLVTLDELGRQEAGKQAPTAVGHFRELVDGAATRRRPPRRRPPRRRGALGARAVTMGS